MDEMSDTLARFVQALNELEITYAIVGSLASSAVGSARSTRDVDMITEMSRLQAKGLAERLKEGFYLDKLAAERAVEERDCFNAIDLKTAYQIDVFIPPQSEWLDTQFERRFRQRVGGPDGPEVYLCSPEDVILSKLAWFRLGNESSNQQMQDVIGVLKVQRGKLDLPYMEKWAKNLAVEDLLARAIQAAN